MSSANKYTPRKPRREKTTLSTNSDNSKDPVHVYCRLRSLRDETESSCVKLLSPTVLAMCTPIDSKTPRKELHFKFKHIFTSYSSQKEVFDHIGLPLIEDLLKGKNGLLFTYGVTGSGKTHTLTGDHNDPGIIPRSIDTIFNSINEFQAAKFIIKSDKMNGFEIQTEDDAMRDRKAEVRAATRTPKSTRKGNGDRVSYVNDGTKIHLFNDSSLYAVFISYIEVYNNTIFDLLDESTGKSLQSKILREDSQKNMYVNGVIEVEVKNAAEAFEVFNSGQKRKRMGNTLLNAESSRSHSIFNIRVVQLEQVALNSEGQPMIPETNMLKISQLSLVDLAGSERTNRTQNTGARLREASSINNSLMSLRTCLEILRENQLTKSNRLVPYRDSRLTFLFKNYFEGDGSVQMIICVSPSVDDFEENLHVMKFGEMTQDVKISKSEARYTPYKKASATERLYPTPKLKTISSCYTVLPEIPDLKFDPENPVEWMASIDRVLKILKIRKHKSEALDEEIDIKTREFRKRLVDLNQENLVNKSELRSLKTVIKREKQKAGNYQIKTTELETVNDNLAGQNEELRGVINSLQNVIREKDLKINQTVLEKEKTKQKLALASEKMTQELDAKLRRQREHLHAESQADKTKLLKLKEVLDCNLPPIQITKKMDEQEQETQTPPVLTDTTHRRNIMPRNTPRGRRSRSAGPGEVWLEHNAIKPVALDTVLQPSMKKRKSVSKLSKATDITNPKQSKYCLIAQDQDTDGEVETKLYKGDILPTCGGGAQVIFNDVERLTQQSPT